MLHCADMRLDLINRVPSKKAGTEKNSTTQKQETNNTSSLKAQNEENIIRIYRLPAKCIPNKV